jgi:hypothetical protein
VPASLCDMACLGVCTGKQRRKEELMKDVISGGVSGQDNSDCKGECFSAESSKRSEDLRSVAEQDWEETK